MTAPQKPEMGSRSKDREDYRVTFTVAAKPEAVFEAVNDVRSWWSGEIDGPTDVLGAEFTYRYQDVHRSTQKITELVPGTRVVWRVTDSFLSFVDDKGEWNGTEMVFAIARQGNLTEVRFTHVGLVPASECYRGCSGAWGFYIAESLKSFIETGRGRPNES